jgi:tRNA U34 2-thiouridine synthase MnmA/TrmU
MSDTFDVEELHWLDEATAGVASVEFDCAVKTRYRQSDLACRVQARGASANVKLRGAARAVTPGQYAVFYDGDECLGGGVIARRYNTCEVARGARDDTPGAAAPAESPILFRFRAEGS